MFARGNGPLARYPNSPRRLRNPPARHAFTPTFRRKEIAVADTNTITTTPEEHRLRTRLRGGADARENGRQPQERRAEDSAFVFDVEDMALVGRPDDRRRWPHQ
jgi:hypothetical protein